MDRGYNLQYSAKTVHTAVEAGSAKTFFFEDQMESFSKLEAEAREVVIILAFVPIKLFLLLMLQKSGFTICNLIPIYLTTTAISLL
jgi:hypothetical protein